MWHRTPFSPPSTTYQLTLWDHVLYREIVPTVCLFTLQLSPVFTEPTMDGWPGWVDLVSWLYTEMIYPRIWMMSTYEKSDLGNGGDQDSWKDMPWQWHAVLYCKSIATCGFTHLRQPASAKTQVTLYSVNLFHLQLINQSTNELAFLAPGICWDFFGDGWWARVAV